MVLETDPRNKKKWLEKALKQGKISQEYFHSNLQKIEKEIENSEVDYKEDIWLEAERAANKLYDNHEEASRRLRIKLYYFILLWPITVVIIIVNSFLDKQWINLLITIFLLILILCVSIPNIRLIGIMQKFSNSVPLRNNKYMSYIGLITLLYASISIWNHSLPYGIIGVIIGMICALINGFLQYMSIQGEKE